MTDDRARLARDRRPDDRPDGGDAAGLRQRESRAVLRLRETRMDVRVVRGPDRGCRLVVEVR